MIFAFKRHDYITGLYVITDIPAHGNNPTGNFRAQLNFLPGVYHTPALDVPGDIFE
jgi:hypothetical protein